MLDLSFTELALVAIVALLVIGPKELPNALRHLGRLTGKARAMTRHVRSGFDEMVRQAEMEEMEKEWRRHNEGIMAATGGPAAIDPFAARDPAGEPGERQPGEVVPDLPVPVDPFTAVKAEAEASSEPAVDPTAQAAPRAA